MAREIPEVVRAAAGLAATVLDEARKLPSTLPGLPVRAIGLALQAAMKFQQQYSGLVARGDELFTGLRGEAEPGLATFDEDLEPATTPGFRDSAFDRADASPATGDAGHGDTITDNEVSGLPDDPSADAVIAAVEDLADQIELAQEVVGDVALDQATEEALGDLAMDELALEELADAAESSEGVATEDADALESALLESDGTGAAGAASTGTDVPDGVDVLTADGDVATVDATVTDEGVATAPTPDDALPTTEEGAVAAVDDGSPAGSDVVPAADEEAGAGSATVQTAATAPADGAGTGTDTGTDTDTDEVTALDESGTPVAAATGVRTDVDATDTSEDDAAIAAGAAVDAIGGESADATDDPEGASDLSGSQAAGTAPIDGYDGFSIAQLRGHLRGYQLVTVQDLLAYEEATRAREPYLRMLRNRLQKLEEQAVESSPLAPRG